MGCFLSNERVDLCHISLEFYSSFQSMAPTLFDSLQIALSISDFLELCEGGWICSLH